MTRQEMIREINRLLRENAYEIKQIYDENHYHYRLTKEEQKMFFAYENQVYDEFDDENDNYSDEEIKQIMEDMQIIEYKLSKGWIAELEEEKENDLIEQTWKNSHNSIEWY